MMKVAEFEIGIALCGASLGGQADLDKHLLVIILNTNCLL